MQEHAFHKPLETEFGSVQRRLRLRGTAIRRIAPIISLIIVLVIWQSLVILKVYPPFIIPAPLAVLNKFTTVLLDGSLWVHIRATMVAVLLGLGVGLSLAVTLGYMTAKSRLLEDLLSPIIVGFQSVPVVAYAPLLVLWFGSGPTSKIVTSALIVFFPMLMNTVVGMRNVSPALRDVMRSMQATRWQTFTKLEVPAAMPVLLGGLKISATLAVIGAVVGEFVSANEGLGFLVNVAHNQYDTPLVIVAVLTLTVIARLLYGLVSVLERRFLYWQSRRG
jgi:putative riboflavin transport system permease protein